MDKSAMRSMIGKRVLGCPPHLTGATAEQLAKLHELFVRSPNGRMTVSAFMADAHQDILLDCIMVPWCGMVIGVEKNGYAHS